MKRVIILGAGLFACMSLFAQVKLEQKWSTDSTLKVPESVLFNKKAKVLYVANIDGQPAEKDGKGSIGKVSTEGKIIEVDWVSGLDAPKGMAMHGNSLWVSDVDQMVEIDIEKGTITRRIPVEGSEFLNDVTVDNKGAVYVSDSRGKKVYKIENGEVAIYLEGLQGPNGLLFHRNELWVLDNGSLLKFDRNKKSTTIAEGMEGGTDGIEHVKGNEYIVSSWGGVVYYVFGDGRKEILLDTREAKINAADIGYDASKKILYVPTFWKNSVVAYELK